LKVTTHDWLKQRIKWDGERAVPMINGLDWLHWYMGNDIDMTGDLYGTTPTTYIPNPPPPPPSEYPPGYTDKTARNVLVVYAQHEISLEDPFAPGEYNDTATAQYLSHYKWLGMTKQEWIAAGFVNPDDTDNFNHLPLEVEAELLWPDDHPFNVIHVGLDTNTDTITPYIVPTATHPNGYYVCDTPLISGLPHNDEGWVLNSSAENLRLQQLVIDIARSGYLDTYLSTNENYCKNVVGKMDFIVIATPQLYKYGYYANDSPGGLATTATLAPPAMVAGAEVDKIFWQPGGWPNLTIHMHEYVHHAYKPTFYTGMTSYPTTPELFVGKTGNAVPVKITRDVPDVYINFNPAPSLPWGTEPCRPCMVRSGRPVHHPVMAASFGLTTLSRWATTSGDYNIGNSSDAWDFLCLQSPYDDSQFMILSAFYPPEIGGTTEYPYGGDEPYNLRKGVYATIVKFETTLLLNTLVHTYDNRRAPVTNYMIETMTEQYQYGDIGLQQYRYNYNDPGQTRPLPNATAVLLDHTHPDTNPSGLSTLNAPFGVKVEWIGWTDIDNVKTAQVTITIDTV
jgi:hypothetical protein